MLYFFFILALFLKGINGVVPDLYGIFIFTFKFFCELVFEIFGLKDGKD